jgi:hypothetical protein
MTTRARLDLLRSLFFARAPRRAGDPRRRARPCLETLEDRVVPAGWAFVLDGASHEGPVVADAAGNVYVAG